MALMRTTLSVHWARPKRYAQILDQCNAVAFAHRWSWNHLAATLILRTASDSSGQRVRDAHSASFLEPQSCAGLALRAEHSTRLMFRETFPCVSVAIVLAREESCLCQHMATDNTWKPFFLRGMEPRHAG